MIHNLTASTKNDVALIDYIQALLIVESVEVPQETIDSLIPTVDINKLTQYLSATSTFLRYRYSYYAIKYLDDCSSHDLN